MIDRFMRSSLLLILLLLASRPAKQALAHAALVRSEPAAGAVLRQAPAVVVLQYSEELDPGLTVVQLVDANAEVIVDGPGVIDPAQPKVLRLPLTPLPDGTYSAVWQARSAVDGHTTNGAVGFSVGVASPTASLLPPPGTPDPTKALPTPADTLLRWLNFITASVAVGPLLFGRLVWRPACQHWSERDDESDTSVTCLLRRLSLLGIGGLALATIGLVMVQAMQAGPGSLADTLKVLLAGRTGALLGARLALLTLLAWLAWRLSLIGAISARVWSVAALLGSAILLTFSLQSHSAALDAGQAIVAIPLDWLHLVATAAWMGGLLPLAFLLASGRIKQELRPLIVRRFSAVALLSVLTLGLTGLGSALIHVRTLDALVATTYGRALLVKSALFAILLGLGAINLLALSPRLSQGGAQALRWLRRTVRLEVAIGVLILLAVGVLTSVAPAFEALEAQERQGVVATAQFDNAQMTLRVAPAQVGENEFGVDIVDRRPGAAAAKPAVLLRFKTADQTMGTTQVETTSQDGRRFTAKGSYLSLSGQWQVTAILRREGFDDLTHTFHVSIPATP